MEVGFVRVRQRSREIIACRERGKKINSDWSLNCILFYTFEKINTSHCQGYLKVNFKYLKLTIFPTENISGQLKSVFLGEPRQPHPFTHIQCKTEANI